MAVCQRTIMDCLAFHTWPQQREEHGKTKGTSGLKKPVFGGGGEQIIILSLRFLIQNPLCAPMAKAYNSIQGKTKVTWNYDLEELVNIQWAGRD